MTTDTTERGLESLISTALTGKQDVREAAAEIPKEMEIDAASDVGARLNPAPA